MNRDVEPSIYERWRAAEHELSAFLERIGVTPEVSTAAVWLHPVPTAGEHAFGETLARAAGADENWAMLVTTPDASGQQFGFAMPVASSHRDARFFFRFVEIHGRVVVWWLLYAWRSRELMSAVAAHADDLHPIAAAACARSLVETAAALWVDARKLESAWREAKAAGSHAMTDRSLARSKPLLAWLNEVQFGGKFDDKAAPETKAAFGSISRTNVLGPVEKLAKVTDGDLQTDYQLLCNVVHPSLGTTLAYGAPPMKHSTGTHSILWFSGLPLEVVELGDGRREAERTVQTAIAMTSTVALTVVRVVLDQALKVVDDIGLTTGAPQVAAFPYWRALRPAPRNEDCPCRSGMKAKRCRHAWGEPVPAIASSFLDEHR
jgi:hypothetical protein